MNSFLPLSLLPEMVVGGGGGLVIFVLGVGCWVLGVGREVRVESIRIGSGQAWIEEEEEVER